MRRTLAVMIGVTSTTRKLKSLVRDEKVSRGRRPLQSCEDVPVGHRRDGIGLGPDAKRVELGRVEPGKGEPARAEEDNVEEEADSGALGRLGRAGDEAGEGDDHGDHLASRADEEHLAATGALDEEERGAGRDGVDDREDAAEDERESGLKADRVLEEDGRVVDDGVAATELLEDLRRGANHHPAEVLLLAALEELAEGGTLLGARRGVDTLDDDANLTLRVLVVEVLVVEVGNDLRGPVVVAVDEEPAGRPE
jgi:hypothetical protein